jgi:hypothetical protein
LYTLSKSLVGSRKVEPRVTFSSLFMLASSSTMFDRAQYFLFWSSLFFNFGIDPLFTNNLEILGLTGCDPHGRDKWTACIYWRNGWLTSNRFLTKKSVFSIGVHSISFCDLPLILTLSHFSN